MLWKRRKQPPKSDLDSVLLSFDRHTPWTFRDAFEGTCILGGNGSGKTSGSGQLLAESFLAQGWGGLVMTTKPDEHRMWETMCERTGRSGDLVLFGAGGESRFNFLDYELNQPGGAGATENLVNLFTAVTEVGDRSKGGERNEGDQFWKRSYKQLLRNAIDALSMGVGKVSVPMLYEMITDIAQSPQEAESEQWQRESSLFAVLEAAKARMQGEGAQHDFKLVARYWLRELPALAEKTRSIILSTFTGIVDCFNRGMMRTLFSTTTSVTPEDAQQGKVIVVNLPVKEWNELGQYAQVVWKFLFQRATERRRTTRPVFLWADEASNFVTSYDALFQSTSRSSRCATVFLCQNLPLYYTALGGEQVGKAAADALLGCMATKIFHANSDITTNNYAAEIIGRTLVRRHSVSMPHNRNLFLSDPELQPATGSVSEQMEFKLLPSEFTTLKKGGTASNGIVEGVIFQNGRVFKATGDNYLVTSFTQKG
jgi:hypothetical protein